MVAARTGVAKIIAAINKGSVLRMVAISYEVGHTTASCRHMIIDIDQDPISQSRKDSMGAVGAFDLSRVNQ